MRTTPGHGHTLSYYHFGQTPFFASQFDQRFSYCLAVPEGYEEDGTEVLDLLVLVHGTERNPVAYRDLFTAFANEHRCMVLAPLFPVGIGEPGELDGYKYIDFHGVRYDEVLLSMIEEVNELYRINTERFMLGGFSGGGHFTHRFYYLHPERLHAISIGAPGVVTLVDQQREWPTGTSNLEEVFGRAIQLDAMREVAVQMLIGGLDTETWEISVPQGSPFYLPGVNDESSNRQQKMRALMADFAEHGIASEQAIVPGVGHNAYEMVPAVTDFFGRALARYRGTEGTHD